MPCQAQHITWGWQLQEYGAMVNKGRAGENQRNFENILLHCCFTINLDIHSPTNKYKDQQWESRHVITLILRSQYTVPAWIVMPEQISRTRKLCSQLMHLQYRHRIVQYQIPYFTWPFTYDILKTSILHIYLQVPNHSISHIHGGKNIEGIYITVKACWISNVSYSIITPTTART